MRYNTCRFCKLSNYDKTKYPLIKYGVRHYAHADCGLRAFGAEFFKKLAEHQLQAFPYFAAQEFSLTSELRGKVKP